jgi:predicted AAA+ superfamily ATPase
MQKKCRFGIEAIVQHLQSGGMPVPAFLRDTEQRDFYWRSWLETTLLRDLSRLFKHGYDPDLAFTLLNRIGTILREGELPTLKHFLQPARKVRAYFSAMQDVFLLRKINCHSAGVGKEVWLLMDSGLATYLMGKRSGEGGTLSLVRHCLWNEWLTLQEYQGKRLERQYYKTAQGSPIDAVFNEIPIRIVSNPIAVTRQLKWEERPLLGAMKKLGAQVGYLVAPVEEFHPAPKKGGIGIIPWGAWS